MKKSKEKCAGPQYEKAENHCSKQKVVLANFETLSKWKMKRIEEASEPHPPAMKTHPHPIESGGKAERHLVEAFKQVSLQ